jgi:hypothetical protein
MFKAELSLVALRVKSTWAIALPKRDKGVHLHYTIAMNTTDNTEENNEDIEAFTVSSETEDGLSVKMEGVEDSADPATEGVGD